MDNSFLVINFMEPCKIIIFTAIFNLFMIYQLAFTRIKSFTFFLLAVLFFSIISCSKEYKMPQEVADIKVNVMVERFDQKFNNLDISQLQNVKTEFPFLFSTEVSDNFWVNKSKDTLQLELIEEVAKVFPENSNVENELVDFYKYLKYYYPQIEEPRIVGLIGEVDYRNRVLLTKELLLLSLDCYLGGDHYFYQDIDKYIRDDFKANALLPDIAMEYAKKIVARPDGRDLISQMIMFGKRRYLLHKLLPTVSLNEILKYSEDEYEWLKENESFIWRYFIEKDLLYSTDKNLLPRFVYPGPFSKFYLEIDQQSPDRVAQFIGFEIVLAFMEHNTVSLPQLMEMDSKSLFESSKYKPRK